MSRCQINTSGVFLVGFSTGSSGGILAKRCLPAAASLIDEAAAFPRLPPPFLSSP